MRITGNPGSGGKKPGTPTIGTATAGNAQATISFTPPTYLGKGGTVTYTATSSPGGLTGTSTSSPITVTGLTNNTSYTFTVTATTSYGVTSDASAASNSVTPSAPFAATGGTITTPGDGYKYHTFTGSGTFTVTSGSQPAGVVLIVAGGGSGGQATTGSGDGGGGGAGGVVYTPAAFTPTGGNGSGVYTVTVGGGASSIPTSSPNVGNPGSPSVFTGLTTAVGGAGGTAFNAGTPVPNQLGGSGGGWQVGFQVSQGTPGQGFPGGSVDSPPSSNTLSGGGAGGRGAAFVPSSTPVGAYTQNSGKGGPGVTYFGLTVGGGGSGSAPVAPRLQPSAIYDLINGPVSNGGRGSLNTIRPNPLGGPYTIVQATSATANSGSGGGGAGNVGGNSTGSGAGGSGIVVVRYPV